MAVINSSTFNFAQTVEHALTRYGYVVYDALDDAVKETSAEAVKRLRASSRAAFGSGDYAKGWTRTLNRGRVHVDATIHGRKPTYMLAHLLEYGHVKANGTGRTGGRVDARSHIAEVEQWANDAAIDRFINNMSAY